MASWRLLPPCARQARTNAGGFLHSRASPASWRGLAMALPGLTVFVFVGLLAAWALVSGVLELRAAFNLATDHGRWWLAIGGIISIVFGIVLVAAPMFGALVVSWWVGAYATFFGATLLVLGFKLRARKLGSGA